MNDIYLKSDNYGYWDIQFDMGDIVVLKKEDKILENGIILALLTQLGEIDTKTYEKFGSELYKVKKENHNKLTQSRIKAYIKKALSIMNKIKRIEKIQINKNDEFEIYVTVKDNTKVATKVMI